MCRTQFRPLAALALVPAGLTVGYLAVLSGVRRSPEELRERLGTAAAASGVRLGSGAAFEIVFGGLLPVILIFGLLVAVALPLVTAAGLFSVVRRANGQFAPVAESIKFGASRLAALLGWSLAGALVVAGLVALLLLPGVLAGSGPLAVAGALVAVLLGLLIGLGVFALLPGVVLIERAGLGRCWVLLRRRLPATGARLTVAAVVYTVYGLGSGLLVSGVSSLVGPRLVTSVLQGLLTIPALIFQIAVAVVTYAELRGREDRSVGTGGLAAPLRLPVLPGRGPGTVSFGGPTATATSTRAPRPRWRPALAVLVLAVLGTGGPAGPGVTSAPPVVPAAAVSPLPASPGDGPGGDDVAPPPAEVSGPAEPAEGDGGTGNGGAPEPEPTVSAPDTKPGGEGPPPGASGADAPRPEAQPAGPTGPSPGQPPAQGAAPGPETAVPGPPAPSAAPGPEAVAPGPPSQAGAPPPDAAPQHAEGPPPPDPGAPATPVAGPPPPPEAEPTAVPEGAAPPAPPGPDPANPAAVGAAQPVDPNDPNAAAEQAKLQVDCAAAACPDRNESGEAVQTAAEPRAMTWGEAGHLALDAAGQVPGIGEIADGINALWYFGEGDNLNGAISAGAMLPVAGNALSGTRAAAKVAEKAGIVYRRTDLNGGKPYVGQTKSETRFPNRQAEHARANPDADFEFEQLGRAEPGVELDRLEQHHINQGGWPDEQGQPGRRIGEPSKPDERQEI